MKKSFYHRLTDWLRWRLGPVLAVFGEKTNIEWLIYNPFIYYSFDALAQRNAPAVISAIAERFSDTNRWLDVGAGSGAFAVEAKRMGREVVACEYSRFGRRLARKKGVDVHAFDLHKPISSNLQGGFDLAYCFEVAEHLPPALGDRLVAFICEHAKRVVFTAAQPGQRGVGHINEQPREYWIERFKQHGFTYSHDDSKSLAQAFSRASISSWFEHNVLVFHR